MEDNQPSFAGLAAKTAVCHTLTYFLMGVLASHFLNYAAEFNNPNSGLRPFNDPWIMAGPLFQPLRGLIFPCSSPCANACSTEKMAGC